MIIERADPSENELYSSKGFQSFDESFFIVGGKFQISNIGEHLFTSFYLLMSGKGDWFDVQPGFLMQNDWCFE